MSALEAAGLRVPEDVSVVGLDDIFFSRLASPPLTTVQVPRAQMGRLAFEALDKLNGLKRKQGVEYGLETSLVIRKSTTQPRWTAPPQNANHERKTFVNPLQPQDSPLLAIGGVDSGLGKLS